MPHGMVLKLPAMHVYMGAEPCPSRPVPLVVRTCARSMCGMWAHPKCKQSSWGAYTQTSEGFVGRIGPEFGLG